MLLLLLLCGVAYFFLGDAAEAALTLGFAIIEVAASAPPAALQPDALLTTRTDDLRPTAQLRSRGYRSSRTLGLSPIPIRLCRRKERVSTRVWPEPLKKKDV